MKNEIKYEKELSNFFNLNARLVEAIAKSIKKINHSVPLEIEDLISYAYYELLKIENKIDFVNECSSEEKIHSFFKRKTYSYMWSYCNLYKSKNHQILNKNLINVIDVNETILQETENYSYDELFSFLTSEEFRVVYEIYVNKSKRNEVAQKMKISLFKIRKLELNAKQKIFQNYNVSF